MTKVVLEIKNEADLRIILPLLDRLDITHWITQKDIEPLSAEERSFHYKIIDEGAPSADLDQRLKDLEDSRKDRELPYRK